MKAHRGKVMRKMGAGSLADLVKMAARLDQAFPMSPVRRPGADTSPPIAGRY